MRRALPGMRMEQKPTCVPLCRLAPIIHSPESPHRPCRSDHFRHRLLTRLSQLSAVISLQPSAARCPRSNTATSPRMTTTSRSAALGLFVSSRSIQPSSGIRRSLSWTLIAARCAAIKLHDRSSRRAIPLPHEGCSLHSREIGRITWQPLDPLPVDWPLDRRRPAGAARRSAGVLASYYPPEQSSANRD